MANSVKQISTFFALAIFLMSQSFLYAQTNQSADSAEAARILRENLSALQSLETKFQTIHENQKKIAGGIHYLRIRNRKKGAKRLGGEDFTRFQKIDEIKRDPDSLKRLDGMIERMEEKVRENDTGGITRIRELISDLLEKLKLEPA